MFSWYRRVSVEGGESINYINFTKRSSPNFVSNNKPI